MWQLDLAQPRIPATERAGYASTEAYLRGFEGKGIWGLSRLEVSYRVQGRAPALALAGTVPDGEGDGFWGRLACAQVAMRSRVMETDVTKVWQFLQEAREYKQRDSNPSDENMVFDPGGTGGCPE